ncbi:hypothetical protein [Nocardia tengchongensis]|uniref:hypothetical protein n=1 Tax=Nocardia tengchongensis TaxID=2055889 RepID=UPI00365A9BAA
MTTSKSVAERPALTAWRARHELRRSNAARPIPSATRYRRSDKNDRKKAERDGDYR